MVSFSQLVDDVATHVRNEGGRHLDAILRLVVLQEGGHDTWQCESRTVQRVTELRLLGVLTTITALQTVGLIGVEIRYGRNLEPTTLSFGLNLEIVADG